jgi:DNA-binding CsgD family transcriptional regulator
MAILARADDRVPPGPSTRPARCRIGWSDFVASIHRVTHAVRPAEQERLGELDMATNGVMASLAATLSPGTFLELLVAPPRLVDTPLHVCVEPLACGGFRVEARVLPRNEGCAPFFRMTAGRLRTATSLLGGHEDGFHSECSPWHGRYSIPALLAVENEDSLEATPTSIRRRTTTRSLVLPLQRDHGLTRAEARVAERLAAGMTIPTIATSLGISVGTVRTHLKKAYVKVGVQRQVDLVRVVLERP